VYIYTLNGQIDQWFFLSLNRDWFIWRACSRNLFRKEEPGLLPGSHQGCLSRKNDQTVGFDHRGKDARSLFPVVEAKIFSPSFFNRQRIKYTRPSLLERSSCKTALMTGRKRYDGRTFSVWKAGQTVRKRP